MRARVARLLDDQVWGINPKPKLQRRLTIDNDGETLDIKYKRSRWNRPYDGGDVRLRTVEGMIMANGEHAGSFSLKEVKADYVTSYNFFGEMDSESHDDSRLAETICHYWQQPSDIFDYGSIVEIGRLWMDPRMSRRGRLARAINGLIEHEFPHRSLTILHAFPLEYEESDSAEGQAFKLRQRAMMRLYSRQFGMSALPGSFGYDGWMYSIPDRLKGLVLPPSSTPFLDF